MNRLLLRSDQPGYPTRLRERLGPEAPAALTLVGNPSLLDLSMTALCSSIHCPGEAVNAAYFMAAKWRDAGRCVISGFHSPMERECLRILLCGPQALIICPARSLENLRVPAVWQDSLERGRLLVLSGAAAGANRVTADLAGRRNDLVVALADEVWFAHITPGGAAERLVRHAAAWHVPAVGPAFPQLGPSSAG